MDVVPEKLITLSQTCLSASQDASGAWTASAGRTRVESRAAGNVQAGFDLVAAHTSAVEAADVAIGRLVATLEADMDGLQQCAFEVSDADETAATALETNRLILPGLTVF